MSVIACLGSSFWLSPSNTASPKPIRATIARLASHHYIQLSRRFTSMNAPILSNILSLGSTSTLKIFYRVVFHLSLLYSTHANPDECYCLSGFFFLAFSLQNSIHQSPDKLQALIWPLSTANCLP
jgi:hypothetical protein